MGQVGDYQSSQGPCGGDADAFSEWGPQFRLEGQ